MLNRRRLVKTLHAAAFLPRAIAAHAATPHVRLLIGTGTASPSTSKGIYLADWNLKTGELGPRTLVAELESPTWLALSPRAPRLYALSEINAGRVTAFDLRRDSSLTLQKINAQTAEGEGPAHLSVNTDGRSAFVANYGSGSITAYKIGKSGALSAPVSHVQYTPVDADPVHARPHAHQATPSPDGRFLLVNDLGSDRILVYRIDAGSGKLTPNSPAFWQARLKSGPRHLVFHPNGRWVYNVNELDSTVDLLYWNSIRGSLTTHGVPVSTLPAGYPAGTAFCSEILTSPDGRFVYAGNRRNETIAALDVNPGSGELLLSQLAPHGGKTARHVTLDPSGGFLLVALQDSNGIAVLARDQRTGQLSDPLHTYPVDSPQCLVFTT